MKIHKAYKEKAKKLVDMMFDKGFIAEDCSRDSMRKLENYVALVWQMDTEMSIKAHDLVKSLKSND